MSALPHDGNDLLAHSRRPHRRSESRERELESEVKRLKALKNAISPWNDSSWILGDEISQPIAPDLRTVVAEEKAVLSIPGPKGSSPRHSPRNGPRAAQQRSSPQADSNSRLPDPALKHKGVRSFRRSRSAGVAVGGTKTCASDLVSESILTIVPVHSINLTLHGLGAAPKQLNLPVSAEAHAQRRARVLYIDAESESRRESPRFKRHALTPATAACHATMRRFSAGSTTERLPAFLQVSADNGPPFFAKQSSRKSARRAKPLQWYRIRATPDVLHLQVQVRQHTQFLKKYFIGVHPTHLLYI